MPTTTFAAYKDFEQKLCHIAQVWKDKQDAYGDVGSCVLGAGFSFVDPNKKKRFLSPCGKWQGSISWEHCKDEIKTLLEEAGAINIKYHWGNMD